MDKVRKISVSWQGKGSLFFPIFHHLFSKGCPDPFLEEFTCSNSTTTKAFAGLQEPWPWRFHHPRRGDRGKDSNTVHTATLLLSTESCILDIMCIYGPSSPLTIEKASEKWQMTICKGKAFIHLSNNFRRNLRSGINLTILPLSWILYLNNYKYFVFLSLLTLIKKLKDFVNVFCLMFKLWKTFKKIYIQNSLDSSGSKSQLYTCDT